MRTPITILLLTLTLLAPTLAAPQLLAGVLGGLTSFITALGVGNIGQFLNLIPILNDPPPAGLFTKYPSPQCANLNQGTLLCCQSTFDGDMPLVVTASQIMAYKLNPNSVNCIYGNRTDTVCAKGTKLCCQVDALVDPLQPVVSLALYCQHVPA